MTTRDYTPSQLALDLSVRPSQRTTNVSTGSSRLVDRAGENPRPAHKRAKRIKPPPPPAWLAWRCVVLAVDTAGRSGWAIRVAGRLVASGEVDTLDAEEIDSIVREALSHALHVCPAVLVLERAWGDNTATLLGLGAARERWHAAWRRACQPKSRIVQVYPVSWRARVLPKGACRLPREQVRPVELACAQHEVPSVSRGTFEVGPDEAAAILISKWAAHAPEVGVRLPKQVRELSRPIEERVRHGR